MPYRANHALQVNLEEDPNRVRQPTQNILYESQFELDVEDVRRLPNFSFRLPLVSQSASGFASGNHSHHHHHPHHEHLPPLPIHHETDSSENDSSNQSTLDHAQWESERETAGIRLGPSFLLFIAC